MSNLHHAALGATFLEIKLSDVTVLEAREYKDKGGAARKHPFVELYYDKNNYIIEDRYILYRLLRVCDDSLRYEEMMQTLYDVTVEQRPNMKSILQGYFDHSEDKVAGAWWSSRGIAPTIINVELVNTLSQHYDTTLEFIGRNYLRDFTRHSRFMTVRREMHPVMCFIKDRLRIEVISYDNRTEIVGRYVLWDENENEVGFVQQRVKTTYPSWAHLIPSHELTRMINAQAQQSFTFIERLRGNYDLGDSCRLHGWDDRNKLERENYTDLRQQVTFFS
tara:strand:+ start:1239 stop:2069 length:831 start_codon:yes stop_codon:yes gene_type:complete